MALPSKHSQFQSPSSNRFEDISQRPASYGRYHYHQGSDSDGLWSSIGDIKPDLARASRAIDRTSPFEHERAGTPPAISMTGFNNRDDIARFGDSGLLQDGVEPRTV